MYKELLDTLTNLKGHFLLSSFPNDVLDEYVLKNGWYVISVNQVKSASRNKDGSKKRKTELLIANYPIKRETGN
jgi:DNA adenine methylase